MGYLSDQKMTPHHKTKMKSLNDSGQLSLDFLVGISIFATILIIASTMISGLLIGLEAKKIDFDAVAYRTGVILVEDPGEPSKMAFDLTVAEEQQWEFVGLDQKDKIRRFGLALYKSTPRVLSEQKVLSFFNRAQYPRATFQDMSEYRNRLIGGDYPYNFNINLRIEGDPNVYTVGQPYNPHSTYGYIKRVVLVKRQTIVGSDIDMAGFIPEPPDPGTNQLVVNMPYNQLIDMSRGPQYWNEPTKESIIIRLTQCHEIRKAGLPPDIPIRLENINMTFNGVYLNGTQVSNIPLPHEDIAVIIDGNLPVVFRYPDGPVGGPQNVIDTIEITFPAGYFIPPSAFSDIRQIQMNIHFTFDPATVNINSVGNEYVFIPGNPGFHGSHLVNGILEVRVW